MDTSVIVDAVRTPVAKGNPGGAYSQIHPGNVHDEAGGLANATIIEGI